MSAPIALELPASRRSRPLSGDTVTEIENPLSRGKSRAVPPSGFINSRLNQKASSSMAPAYAFKSKCCRRTSCCCGARLLGWWGLLLSFLHLLVGGMVLYGMAALIAPCSVPGPVLSTSPWRKQDGVSHGPCGPLCGGASMVVCDAIHNDANMGDYNIPRWFIWVMIWAAVASLHVVVGVFGWCLVWPCCVKRGVATRKVECSGRDLLVPRDRRSSVFRRRVIHPILRISEVWEDNLGVHRGRFLEIKIAAMEWLETGLQLAAAVEHAKSPTKAYAFGIVGVALVNTMVAPIFLWSPRRIVHRDRLVVFEILCDLAFFVLSLTAVAQPYQPGEPIKIMELNDAPIISWLSIIWPTAGMLIFLLDLLSEISYDAAAANWSPSFSPSTFPFKSGIKQSPLSPRHRGSMLAVLFGGYVVMAISSIATIVVIDGIEPPPPWLPPRDVLIGDLVQDIGTLECSGALPFACDNMAVPLNAPESDYQSGSWLHIPKDVCVASSAECHGSAQRALRCKMLRNLTAWLEHGLSALHVFEICSVKMMRSGNSTLRFGASAAAAQDSTVVIELFSPDVGQRIAERKWSKYGSIITQSWGVCDSHSRDASPLSVQLLGLQSLGKLSNRSFEDEFNGVKNEWPVFERATDSDFDAATIIPAPLFDPAVWEILAAKSGNRADVPWEADSSGPTSWHHITLGNGTLSAAREAVSASNLAAPCFAGIGGSSSHSDWSRFGDVKYFGRVSAVCDRSAFAQLSRDQVEQLERGYSYKSKNKWTELFMWTPPVGYTWLNFQDGSSTTRIAMGTAGGEAIPGCRGTATLGLLGPKHSRNGDTSSFRHLLAQANVEVDLCGDVRPDNCIRYCREGLDDATKTGADQRCVQKFSTQKKCVP